jgi:hypothetical protein
VFVKWLIICPIHPVEDVKQTIGSEEEDIVSSKVLDFSIALQNNKLWNDG